MRPIPSAAMRDLPSAVPMLAGHRFYNAAQVRIAPTPVLVETSVYGSVLEDFVTDAKAMRVGDGLAEGVEMGSMANARGLNAIDRLIGDAVARGGASLPATTAPAMPDSFASPQCGPTRRRTRRS